MNVLEASSWASVFQAIHTVACEAAISTYSVKSVPFACREFTLNMISEWFVESANHTSGSYDPEVDELDLSGFTSTPSKKVGQTQSSKNFNRLWIV